MSFLFFFNDPATTEIYTLSLHDALPISGDYVADAEGKSRTPWTMLEPLPARPALKPALPISPPAKRGVALECKTITEKRSEEHTSELQSRLHLVCRLLLEKKKLTHHHTT